jgi:hypothetical protein
MIRFLVLIAREGKSAPSGPTGLKSNSPAIVSDFGSKIASCGSEGRDERTL